METQKQALRRKLQRKASARKRNVNKEEQAIPNDFGTMINQVQSILQKNPDMVQKVNSCMKNILSNEEFMKNLSSQMSSMGITQTLDSSTSGSEEEATSNASTQ